MKTGWLVSIETENENENNADNGFSVDNGDNGDNENGNDGDEIDGIEGEGERDGEKKGGSKGSKGSKGGKKPVKKGSKNSIKVSPRCSVPSSSNRVVLSLSAALKVCGEVSALTLDVLHERTYGLRGDSVSTEPFSCPCAMSILRQCDQEELLRYIEGALLFYILCICYIMLYYIITIILC